MNQVSKNQVSKKPNTPGTSGLSFEEPLVFEMGSPGRKAYSLSPCDVPEVEIETLLPPKQIRQAIDELPELSELDVVRHYTRLSQWNFNIDTNFYPLGSCTMKYNPKINEIITETVPIDKETMVPDMSLLNKSLPCLSVPK